MGKITPNWSLAEDGERRHARKYGHDDAMVHEVKWGAYWGAYLTPAGWVEMRRAGQKVRFLNGRSEQVGPEQSNVAPAVAYALSQGWK